MWTFRRNIVVSQIEERIKKGVERILNNISGKKNIGDCDEKFEESDIRNIKEDDELKQKSNFEICCAFITAVSDKEPNKARERAAKTLAFYVAVGKYYNKFLLKTGYEYEVNNITEEYKKNGIENIHKFVSDRMLESLTICGTKEECRRSLEVFVNTGITLPIIQINPVGKDPESSIMELLSTF